MRVRLGKGAAALSVAALLGFGATVAAPASAAGVTFWVDAAAASTGPGSGCGADAAYTTIQAAVTAAAADDIIEVCPGTYAGPVTINRTNLTLRGAKAGVPAGPAATPADRGTGETIIESAGGNAISWSGVNPGTTIDGFTIRNTGTSGNSNGISVGSAGHTIVNNIVEFAGSSPGSQNSGIIAGAIPGHTIRNNSIRGFRYGMNLQSGNLADPSTRIEGNFVDFVFTGLIFGTNTANGHVITGNRIVGRPGHGGQGISTPSRSTEISNNTLIGGGNSSGIWVQNQAAPNTQGPGPAITGNTIQGFAWGIYQDSFPTGTTPTEAHGNNIVGNSAWAIFNVGSTTARPIEATCNWFGDIAGPGVGSGAPAGNRVSANTVNFTPWSVASNPGGACTGGLPDVPVVRVADAEVLEPASGQSGVFVPVMLDAPATENVTVRFFTTSGSAAGGNAPGVGVDFRNWGSVSSPRSVTIPAGSTQATINVPVYADGVSESNETFTVTIASVSGGDYVVSGENTATGTIIDADHLEVSEPVLNISNAQMYEGDDGARRIQLYVQLNKPAESDLLVALGTQDGSAVAGGDYNARSFTMRIPAGSTTRTFDVTLLNDALTESSETFTLVGAVSSGPLVEELSTTGTATILDND